MKSIVRPLVGFLSAVAGALLVVALFHSTLWGKDSTPNITVSTTPINRDVRLGTSYASIVKKAAPSVVTIYSTRTIREEDPFQDNPMLRQFFGVPDDQPRIRREEGLGSGVIVSPNGYILTANHVVNGADEIQVSMDGDQKVYPAKIVGADPQTDVAVLKIDATGLPAITLADSDQLEIGDVVLAIGNPFGLGQSVSQGIVSGLGRHYEGIKGYQNFIQTDAAINKGNSGGALVDAEGRLIGINTWIASSSGGSEGIGFAVPINLARRSMESLITSGRVTHGYLGVHMQDVTSDLAQELNLPTQNGVLVDDVLPDTPAAKAGIKPDDVIVALNGKDVPDSHNLRLEVSECPPGTPVTLKLIRNGADRTISITLAELPGEVASLGNDGNTSVADKPDALDGVTVDDLNSDVRQQLRVPENIHGAIVTGVDDDSNAADADLQPNDIIIGINRHPVASADDAVRFCRAAKGGEILVKIWRRAGHFAGTSYLTVDNTSEK